MKYVLSGYFGFGNAGDDAILTAMVEDVRRLDPEAEFTVIGPSRRRLSGGDDSPAAVGAADLFARLGVHVVPRDDWRQVLGALRSADLVISGGGGLLQDSTSRGSLAFYTGHLLAAQLLRRRRMVYAQGVGPLGSFESRMLVRLALRGATVSVRDQESAELLRRCGVHPSRIHVTADPVFGWASRFRRIWDPGARRAAGGAGAGSGWAAGSGADLDDDRPGLAIIWRSFLASGIGLRLLWPQLQEWARSRGLHPVFFALQPSADVTELRQAGVPREAIVTFEEPERWPAALAGCRLSLSVRYHGVLFSALAGVPSLGIAYDPKVVALCRQLGLPEPLAEDAVSGAQLLARLEELERAADRWRAELPARLERLAEAAARTAQLAVATARGEAIPAPGEPVGEGIGGPLMSGDPLPGRELTPSLPAGETEGRGVRDAGAAAALSTDSGREEVEEETPPAPTAPASPAVLGVALDPVTLEEAAQRVLAWTGLAPGAGDAGGAGSVGGAGDPGGAGRADGGDGRGSSHTGPGDGSRGRFVVTANPELIMRAQGDPAVRDALAAADMVVADGVGVVWAARRLGTPVPGRVPGVDLAEAIMERGALLGLKVYLLGARRGVASRAAVRLRRRFPGLEVVGAAHGYFAPDEDDEVVARVRASGAHLLLVGLGAPRQELWLSARMDRLGVPAAMGVGGAFDVWAGRLPRAPRWMQKAGVEWIWRAVLQPSRIVRLAALPRFAWRVLRLAPIPMRSRR